MCNDLTQRCADEFERHVDNLVAAHKHGKILAPNPFFDRPFSISDVPRLKYLVRTALQARRWFAKHGPPWAQPLPLSDLERIGFFMDDDNAALPLAAMYSLSLQARDFDCLSHPQLFDYCRGVMASEHAQDYLRKDSALLAEFPPKELAGLDERCRWRPLRHRASQLIEDHTLDFKKIFWPPLSNSSAAPTL